MPERKKRQSIHYCGPNSVPLTVGGSTDSHAPVHLILPICCASGLEASARTSPGAVSAASACCHRIYRLPSPISRAWSPDLNSSILRSAATRFPVMTQYSIQFALLSELGMEGDTSLLDRQTGYHPPGDLSHVPLKEGWEKGVLQIILYRLKFHPYVRGDALHEVPLLLEGFLHSRVCGLQVPMLHPIQVGHQVPISLNLIPQPPRLPCLCSNKSPNRADPCHNPNPVSLK